ncbi:2-phosphoxylose phosphatase 1-like isoform X2 [Mya arenaria]|uniref:2-phosphoxylose phosphatase 1-like isoform X2 n=1 Tax=Mya arenaria TaxID=6604 RepID=UPI0022E6A8CC|nr:2-phosphoxylose phosphatase 1-like isoform X2 [Mya arenaria]
MDLTGSKFADRCGHSLTQTGILKTMIRRKRFVLKIIIIVILLGFVALFALGPLFHRHSEHDGPVMYVDTEKTRPNVHTMQDEGTYENASSGDVEYIEDYCNSPFKPLTGDEGAVPEGYKLRLVHVFTRHGDRTSLHALSGFPTSRYSCHFASWYNGSDPKIRYFPQYMDKMAGTQRSRSHFNNWSLYPNKAKCGPSELTSRGALQHIRNGQHLFKKYIARHGLISLKENYSSQVIVKSTAYSRTYQSANAFLYGFLPQYNVSILGIQYSQSLEFCSSNPLSPGMCSCRRVQTLRNRLGRFSSLISSNRESHRMVKRRVANVLAIDYLALPWLSAIGDILTPAYCHNLPKYCSGLKQEHCVSGPLINSIWKEVTETENILQADVESKSIEYANILMYPVLLEIAQRLILVSQGRLDVRFVLYSGHDVTLAPLLQVLGIHNGRFPPYASRLVIEALEATKTHLFMLKFIYNGVDTTRRIPFCESDLVDGMCPLKVFHSYVVDELSNQYELSGCKVERG